MPELKLYQLEQQLQQKPTNFWNHKCFLFVGEENFLKEEILEKTFKRIGLTRENVEYIDAEVVKGGEITATLNTVGFDDERKVVVVRNSDYIDAATCKYLYESWDASDIPDTVLPVFLAEQVDQRRRLWQLVKEEGTFCTFWPMFEDKLIVWIGQRMQAVGLKFERGCDTLLAALCGNNLRRITKEIEKMVLLGQFVSQDLLKALVKKAEDAKKYEIEDLFCQRQIAKLFGLLQELEEQVEPKDIAMSISRCIRYAIQAKSYLKNKKEYAEQLLNAGKHLISLQHRKDWPGISKRNEIIKAAGVIIKGIPAQDKMVWTGNLKLDAQEESAEKVITQATIEQDSEGTSDKKKPRGKAKKAVNFSLDTEKEKQDIAEKRKRARDLSNEVYNHNLWANKVTGNIVRAFVAAGNYSDEELLETLIRMSNIYFSLFTGGGDLIRANIDSVLVTLMAK